MYDICIIGGGPAGMTTAIEAATNNPKARICLIEKNDRLGKKLYATGNGKCNLAHASCENLAEVMKFFNRIGIITRQDDQGRLYPASEQAADVVHALENALTARKVQVMRNIAVMDIQAMQDGFCVHWPNGTLTCRKLLIATGGKAGPQYGTVGEGYTLAKQLGHRIIKTFPVLSPLECQGAYQSLKGVRAKADVSLKKAGQLMVREAGEIQFTEDGLSGICVFNLSRFVQLNGEKSATEEIREYEVSIDFVPGMNEDELFDWLSVRRAQWLMKPLDLMLTLIHPQLNLNILKQAEISPTGRASEITDDQIRRIATLLKHWNSTLLGVKGWKKAQCTGGGVPLDQINPDSQESRLINGLFFAGEILDYDGPSGGFNLHYAWITGIKAGKAMADESV